MNITYKVRDDVIEEYRKQARDKSIDLYLLAGQIMKESSWNMKAIAQNDVGPNIHSYGLMQINRYSARDAGWDGPMDLELIDPLLNLQLGTSYFLLCRKWAGYYNTNNEVITYGLDACALSVYQQGPGGFQNNGIAANLQTYVIPIMEYKRTFELEGLYDVEGRTIVMPSTISPPPLEPPPVAPPPIAPSVIEELTKYQEVISKSIKEISAARPWPPEDQFHSDVAKIIYNVSVVLRDLITRLTNWLDEI